MITQAQPGVPEQVHAGMRHLPGGVFVMGSDDFYPEERPTRRVRVEAFRMDASPVTNRQFAEFVAATGHRTLAETSLNPAEYPGVDPALLAPGSLVFISTDGPVDLRDPGRWWHFIPGAQWRHPLGPDSSLAGLDDHPVVHVALRDAAAYAQWAGKSLPTEAEWEYAARGGLQGQPYAWGDELVPRGNIMANYWQGEFPWRNLRADAWQRTSAVGVFPPNEYGLYDMIGNVWEWTSDEYSTGTSGNGCCDLRSLVQHGCSAVIKGGSHLCAANYCQRYRPAARAGQAGDSPASHIGFRCIVRD